MGTSVFISDKAGIIDDGNARDIARSLDFLGAGITRDVFDLGDVVLKIDKRANGFAGDSGTESDVWENVCLTSDARYFAEVFASGDGWLIMEKVENVIANVAYSDEDLRDVREAGRRNGVGRDLHEWNIGIRYDGSMCIIDYAYSGEQGADSWEHDECMCDECQPCSCGDHDCERCFPEGCGCETWEGCKRVECSHCYSTAHRFATGEMFGFVRIGNHPVCAACDPQPAKPVTRIDGQVKMVLRFATYIGPVGPAHSFTLQHDWKVAR